jgi:hypothetical protein
MAHSCYRLGMAKYAYVSHRALLGRLNRALRPRRKIQANRSGGPLKITYVVLDTAKGEVVEHLNREDLHEFAARLNVLREWERLQ